MTTKLAFGRAATTRQIAAVGRLGLPPLATSRIGSRVSGRVVRLFVSLGQKVRRGQALVLLDSPTVGLSRARFLRAASLMQLAEIELRRTRRLKKIGVASAKALVAARAAYKRAQIDLRSTRAQLDVLGVTPPSHSKDRKKSKRLSGRFVLRAPFAGEVTALPRSLGAWVSPQDAILRVEQRKKVWALLEIYARDLPYVRVGQEVHLYGPGIHHHLEGRISYLSSRFERGAQTLEARVVLSNPRGQLRPGQFVYGLIQRRPASKAKPHDKARHKAHKPKKARKPQSAKNARKKTKHKDEHAGHDDKADHDKAGHQHKVAKGTAPTPQAAQGPGVLILPEDAVQRLGQRQIVFVVGDAPGHFQVRTVVTVEAPHGNVRVLHGLKAGERVVVRGAFVLKSELMRASLESEHGHSH